MFLARPVDHLEMAVCIELELEQAVTARIAQLSARGGLVTQPDRVAGYSLMMRSLIDAETPSVIHCSAGKDRTGWGATLVLLLLGVHEATVIEHYLESNQHRALRPAVTTAPKVDIELLRPFFEVRS